MFSATSVHQPKTIALCVAAVVLWFAYTAWAFWWLDARDRAVQRPFVTETGNRELEALPGQLLRMTEVTTALRELPTDAAGALLYFRDADCPCSRGADEVVNEILERHRREGLRLLTIERGTASRGDLPGQRAFAASALSIPSSPALALLSRDGEMAYFGPHMNSAHCTPGAPGVVDRVIRAMRGGSRTRVADLFALGCFCRWKTSTAGGQDLPATASGATVSFNY